MTNTNNELTDFQKKVFAEYETAKSLKKTSELLKRARVEERKGCSYVLIYLLTELTVTIPLRIESRKKNYTGNEQEARELLRQKEISDRICQMIAKISRKQILTEEKFVRQFTATLFQSDLANRFVIPENAVLYALMATEIYNIGLENFCNSKKGDE